MDSLSELHSVVQRLADEGLTRSRRGQWTLAQLCDHLAKTIEGSCPGGDLGPRIVPRLLGPVVKWFTIWTRWMPSGLPAPAPLVPEDDGPIDEAVARLARAVDAFIALADQSDVAMTPSPAFGRMSYNDWRRIHVIHSNHHVKVFAGGTR